MEFKKLRLSGFKSFADSLELAIESGLTGIVGPNGCGKSNLVEALRWVMGESSYKNMRASSMEEVIFSGSSKRHARLMAEVILFLDNKKKKAPAAFNSEEEIQISRRIEKDSGSSYRVNGHDVRARDVQLLFADVSTGARSPSMIGQGRVGELISAKPQSRRALLEEAAGISGLYSRRHEAELRLNGASANLEKLDDVIAGHDSRLEALKRQARQATRYRNIAGDIRALEALILHLAWGEACTATNEGDELLTSAQKKLGEAQITHTNLANELNKITEELRPLRENEAQASAKLQHVKITTTQLDDEEKRLSERVGELENLHTQLLSDKSREENIIMQITGTLENLTAEETALQSEAEKIADTKSAQEKYENAAKQLATTEEKLESLNETLAARRAQKSRYEKVVSQAGERRQELTAKQTECEKEIATLDKRMKTEFEPREQSGSELADLEGETATAKTQAKQLADELEQAMESEQSAQSKFNQAQTKLEKVQAEMAVLEKLINPTSEFPTIISQIEIKRGYEQALAAALGDELNSSTNESAPAHWRNLETLPAPEFPPEVEVLASKIKAPAQLQNCLSYIGVVDENQGHQLQAKLKAGQKLVSKQGDLWRWDGYKADANVSTAAKNLQQKARIEELQKTSKEVQGEIKTCEAELQKARQQTKTIRENLSKKNSEIQSADEKLESLRQTSLSSERDYAELSRRHAVLLQTKTHIQRTLAEIDEQLESEKIDSQDEESHKKLEQQFNQLSETVAAERDESAKLQANYNILEQEIGLKRERLETIERDKTTWNERLQNAKSQIAVLEERIGKTQTQAAEAKNASGGFDNRRQKLLDEMSQAQQQKDEATQNLSGKESQHTKENKKVEQASGVLQEARENHIRAQERLDAATARRNELEARIRTELECEPEQAIELAGYKQGETNLPNRERSEKKLENVKAERERLGAVNLQAQDEYDEISGQKDSLLTEREDLLEAIARLRKAITSLNKEGRTRLLAAFDKVNEKFQNLFQHLFAGGEARLELVESDDPLEAGLEILACPPGKKLQTMTLLSGGEQALTALALIFAVFLTNPAPICVLDEVDAPLDDHNVERFCKLMENMSETTDTRFIVITHNPITMARMHRLFGVTMAERGVSQLVSVDLQTAESYREVA